MNLRSFLLLFLVIITSYSHLAVAKTQTNKPSIYVKLATVKPILVSKTIKVYGTIAVSPDAEYQLSVQEASRVKHVFVKKGEYVAKGTPLVAIMPTTSTDLKLQVAKINQQFAQKHLNYIRTLFNAHLINNAEIRLKEAQQNYAKDEATLNEMEKNFKADNVKILVAPNSGVITQINYHPGQIAASGSILLTLSNNQQLQATFNVPLNQAKLLKPRQKIRIAAIFNPANQYIATITTINQLVNPDNQSITLTIPLGKATKFIVGTKVVGEIYIIRHKSMLAIPYSAILYQNDKPYVFIDDNNTAKKQWIHLGFDTGKEMTVIRGLKAGQKVIYVGNYELKNGMPIRTEFNS